MLVTVYLHFISCPKEFHLSEIVLSSRYQTISFIRNIVFSFCTCKSVSLLFYLFNIRRNRYIFLPVPLKKIQGSWRYGLAVRSTCCSCRGIVLNSQHPNDGSQPTITPVVGYAIVWPPKTRGTHMIHIHICRQNTHT